MVACKLQTLIQLLRESFRIEMHPSLGMKILMKDIILFFILFCNFSLNLNGKGVDLFNKNMLAVLNKVSWHHTNINLPLILFLSDNQSGNNDFLQLFRKPKGKIYVSKKFAL